MGSSLMPAQRHMYQLLNAHKHSLCNHFSFFLLCLTPLNHLHTKSYIFWMWLFEFRMSDMKLFQPKTKMFILGLYYNSFCKLLLLCLFVLFVCRFDTVCKYLFICFFTLTYIYKAISQSTKVYKAIICVHYLCTSP